MAKKAKIVKLDIYGDLIKPFERQMAFIKAAFKKKFTLYGGAMGGGKSYILRWLCIDYLLRLASAGIKAEAGLFCETFPALDDRHLDKARQEFPTWLGHWRKYDFHLYEGGIVKFRNLDAPEKYKSAEFAMIAVDELTMNPMDTFDILRTRLRWPGVQHTPFVAASNPGGKGHQWVKQIWLDGNPHDYLLKSSENPDGYVVEDFVFVPSKAKDNPHLHRDYFGSLATMPELMKRAYLDGDWSVFAGMFFPMFSRQKHVVEPFKIPRGWPITASLDPAWGGFLSFGVYATDFNGAIYKLATYKEKQLSPPQHCENIWHLIQKTLGPYTGGQVPYVITAGWDAWAKKDRHAILSNEATMADVFEEYGLPLTKAVVDRKPGWWKFKTALEREQLRFFGDGMNEGTIQEIESVLSDETDPEDIQGKGRDPQVGDHGLDETRYMLMTVYTPEEARETKQWQRPPDYRPKQIAAPSQSLPTGSYTRDWRAA